MTDRQLYTLCGVILLTGGWASGSVPLFALAAMYFLGSLFAKTK
jgi:hypothetical protein